MIIQYHFVVFVEAEHQWDWMINWIWSYQKIVTANQVTLKPVAKRISFQWWLMIAVSFSFSLKITRKKVLKNSFFNVVHSSEETSFWPPSMARSEEKTVIVVVATVAMSSQVKGFKFPLFAHQPTPNSLPRISPSSLPVYIAKD